MTNELKTADEKTEKRKVRLRSVPTYLYPVKGAGIYAIINNENLKVYVGSTVNFRKRWATHKSELSKGKHHSAHLQRAFDKNPNAFSLEVLQEIPNADKETLLKAEQFWMDFYKCNDRTSGYNTCPDARSCQGIKLTPERCKQMSISLKGKTKGRKFSPERLAAHRLIMINRKPSHWTEEQRKKVGDRFRGKSRSTESIKKQLSKQIGRKSSLGKETCQYDKDGNFVRKFRTGKEADRAFPGNGSRIRTCVKNPTWKSSGYYWRRFSNGEIPNKIIIPERNGSRIRTCVKNPTWKSSGYYWRRFSNGEIPNKIIIPERNVSKRLVPVLQIDFSGKILAKWKSVAEAARSFKRDLTNIVQACKHKQRTAHGFYWRYACEVGDVDHVEIIPGSRKNKSFVNINEVKT